MEPLQFNPKLESSIEIVEDSTTVLNKDIEEVKNNDNTADIEALKKRLAQLYQQAGVKLPIEESIPLEATPVVSEEPMGHEPLTFPDELSKADIVMTCIAGGIAVLVDFLIVKIPKSVDIVRDGSIIHQEGSPMTAILRKIGFDSDGKTSAWVKILEKYFNVPFDKSIIEGEKGFTPRSHRLYSLAHDPSPSGLLWAIKDILTGTTSYIDKAGHLKIVKTTPASLETKLLCPIVWIGHIVSDIFTKAGVPIPGSCLLRTLQIGSFGAKKRTLGQVVEYMYLEGYDLRHLATMSFANAAIELILRIYHALTRELTLPFAVPNALLEAEKSMYAHRLSKMRLGAYAVAATGNVGKMAIYQWNPTALNLPIWVEFLRTSISEFQRAYRTDSPYIEAVKNREKINRTFDELEERLKRLSQ